VATHEGHPAAERGDGLRLFLAAFTALFLELALIRFEPAYVRVVGYYTNLILIASFLGLGIGFLLSGSRRRLEGFLLPLVLLVAVAVAFFHGVVVVNPENTDEPLWLIDYGGDALRMSITPVVLVHFVVSAAALVPLGQVMGRLFGRFDRLRAYSLDLGGSFCGVVAFGLLSALRTGPVVWFSIVSVVALVVLLKTPLERGLGVASSVAILAIVVSLAPPDSMWSPYYMVEIDQVSDSRKILRTNGTLHQVMLDFERVDDSYVKRTRDRFEVAYKAAKSLDDVLVVGAGTGNDLAMALRMGAKRIDAVEIDPLFPQIGAEHHFQNPYADERVTVHISDARRWFKRTDRRYDLIVFGTVDSQALLSGMSSIRLDNYIYTEESFKEAFALLKPGGTVAVFHMSVVPYIADRILLLMEKASGRRPLALDFPDHTLFNALFLSNPDLPEVFGTPEFEARLAALEVPTDDWPFLYLRRRMIPSHYLKVVVGILVITLLTTGPALMRRRNAGLPGRFDGPLFLLGAGFLLLETRSVTEMSLMFGSTWTVNLLVFGSILAALWGANLFVLKRGPDGFDVRVLVGLLTLAIVGTTAIPASFFSSLPPVPGILSGGLYVAAPILLAGLLFPVLFARAADAQAAFASNLMGAIAGGCTEYLTMQLGITALAYLAATFYLAALLWHLRRVAAGV
jgi:SAM-dependent methyltransferase